MNLLLGKGSAPIFSHAVSCRVECVSLPVSVQFCSAMLMCDVDGDGRNELVLGSDDGELCVVKDGEASIVASELGVVRFVVDVRLHERVALIAALSCDGELRVLSMHSLTRLLRLHKLLVTDATNHNTATTSIGVADASDALVTLARRSVAESAPTAIYVKPCGELGARDWAHPELAAFDRAFTSLLYVATDTRTVTAYAIGLAAGRLECRELDAWLVPFDVVAIAPTNAIATTATAAADDAAADELSGVLAMYHPALCCLLLPSTPSAPARTVLPSDLNMREAGVTRVGPVMVVVPPTRTDAALGSATNRHQLRMVWNRTKQGRVDLPQPDQIRAVHLGRFGSSGDVELVAVCPNGVVYFYDRFQNLRRAVLHQPLRCSTAGELSVYDAVNNSRRTCCVLAVVNAFNELSIFQFD